MIETGKLIKELTDQQSKLGQIAKSEASSHEVGAHDYNESLVWKGLDDNKSEPWWTDVRDENKFEPWWKDVRDENKFDGDSEHHIIDFDEPLSNPNGVFNETIPVSERNEKMNSVLEKNAEPNINEQQSESESEKTNAWYCPKEGSGGSWEGDRGNSKWIPDDDYTPQKHNPENKTWGDIKSEYGIDGVDFKDGEPDFSEVSKGEVTLDQKETDRGIVFNEADTKLAEQRGCEPWEVYKWRKENGYTWHETSDGLRAQKVPNIVHGNVSHAGGHSNNLKTL